jgi:cell division protein FtsZ
LGALTVAVVTDPFSFEQRRKSQHTKEGIVKLTDIADMVITIPISRLSKLKSKKAAAIKKSDEVILYSVKGITDLIMRPGLINLDFADVKAIISKAGLANIGIGISTGANRALEASEKAIYHPLLRNNSIVGAKSVLMNITCNSDMTMDEITEASERIYNEIDDDNVEIIWGTVVDDSLGDELRVTVIAIGTGGGEVQMAISPKTIKTSNKDHYPQAGYDIPTFLRKKEK